MFSTDTIPSSFIKGTVKYSAADSTVTDIDKHIVKLYGKACITNSSTRVNADYIEFNSVEKTGTAKGNVHPLMIINHSTLPNEKRIVRY